MKLLSLKPRLLIGVVTLYLMVLTACGQTPGKSAKAPVESKVKTMSQEEKIQLSDSEWKAKLSEEQYYVLREKGTERPFKGKFLFHKKKGTYTCAGCGAPLFSSDAKFDSHCGWPSFDKEQAEGKIKKIKDSSLGMDRVEIVCARCDGHLGHVFEDGPTETGLRYCVNSLSLGFEEENPTKSVATTGVSSEAVAVLGGGCFWCVEAVYQQLKGVTKVESGYSGGKYPNPTYKEVCTGNSGHAEVIKITYNPSEVSFKDILEVFFTVHDPTTLNRQGNDVGTQYRSVIFYTDATQQKIAEEVVLALNKEKAYSNPLVTEISPLKEFFKAEDYHQNYYNDNQSQPYCRMVVQPKLVKFKKVFHSKLKP